MNECLAIVLAAGQGKRMKSDLPKVLHKICGRSLLSWVLASLDSVGVSKTCVVVGHGSDSVKEAIGDTVDYAHQREQLGTGHAVLCAEEVFKNWAGSVLVLAGDVPLISSSTISKVVELQQAQNADVVMATFELGDPTGYGRIVRDAGNRVIGIVEEKDASLDQRKITEVNPAVYCFNAETLRTLLPKLSNSNAQGEYYLTDLIMLITDQSGRVLTVKSDDPDEFLGINDRWQLSEAAALMNRRILKKHIESGVEISDINSVNIEPGVVIEPGAKILPGTILEGNTTIGEGSSIGPNTWIKDSAVGKFSRVFMSHLDGAQMGERSRCGPFANLRPGAVLHTEAKIGNFVEIKNSEIGSNTSISHLTYIGDAKVGEKTNIGAGTITCNYDGFNKFRTEIGDECFIGSNSTLIAPVRIEGNSFVAAGSVISRDVPSGAMAIGRGKQENKEQWYTAWRERKNSVKE